MKFSDILKRKDSSGTPPSASPEIPAIPPLEMQAPTATPPGEHSSHWDAPGPKSSALGAATGMAQQPVADEPEEVVEQRIQAHSLKATEVYSEAVSQVRTLYKAAANAASAGRQDVPQGLLQNLITVVQSGNQELLALADRSAPDNYLYGHAVNVAIFSVRLGLTLHLPAGDLYALALGAFLHDIGMGPCLPLALKPGPLNESEFEKIRLHPAENQKLLTLFPDLSGALRDAVFQIVGQVHERPDGSGYPDHRAGDAIHRLAKIVGLCDVYEALTHVRAWRGRYLPHIALRQMIEVHERTFEPGNVKTLIESLSLYPPGSFVRLSSGDIGRVIQTNAGLPTRPKIKTLVASGGARISVPRIVNLATQPIHYIVEPVDETKIQTTDQRLLLELKAQRWWVKGL